MIAPVLPPDPDATHRRLLAAQGVLLVLRAPRLPPVPVPGQPGAVSTHVPDTPEIFVAVQADGRVLAFNGHVDLGTGIGTALTQIVAEELDVAPGRIEISLGHTDATPNQGPTIASATLQIAAVPLRRAAAQARQRLLARAADALGCDAATLTVDDGRVVAANGAATDYWQLLAGQREHLELADDVAVKLPSSYRVVGSRLPRVDIAAKATGGLTYVHDLRLPNMLHGRVVRPPYAGRDVGEFVGRSLRAVDEASLAHLPGIVKRVVIGDFVGIVAEREEQAVMAARQLKLTWAAVPDAPDLSDVEAVLRRQPAVARRLIERGDVDAALGTATTRVAATYVWPYQMHASIGPSCAVAEWHDDGLTVWSGTQNPHLLRIDLARLLDIGEDRIAVVRMEAAGCYGRNCADDVAADAALLSRAAGRPVRVQLSREQEHAWEPKGAAQLVDVAGAIDAEGRLQACDFATRYPSNDAPTLALLLTGRTLATPRTLEMGDRTAVPPYTAANLRVTCHDMPAIVRASWLRGVSALPNCFAHESFIDELAHAAGLDAIALRRRHLNDDRALALIDAVTERASWRAGQRGSRGVPGADGLLHGRGFAQARYIHSQFPGFGAAWAAWAVDLTVDPQRGHIRVTRVVVGQDNGLTVNPDGVRHQIHGNVIQTLSRTLKERVAFDASGVVSREWGAYPILGFTEVPAIEVLLMPRPDDPPLGVGESASLPGPAAVANALFDATGLRWRRPPFTPDVVRAALSDSASKIPAASQPHEEPAT